LHCASEGAGCEEGKSRDKDTGAREGLAAEAMVPAGETHNPRPADIRQRQHGSR